MALGKRRHPSTILTVAVAVALAGIAYAYFPVSGAGTAGATVGAGSPLTIHASVAGTLHPGGSAAVSFTVDNPASGHQELGTIHLASIRACVGPGSSWNGSACSNNGAEARTCESVETGASDTNTANFWMADVVSNQDFGGGSGQSVTATGTLQMNDLSTNQDACRNADLTLNFTS